jgi:hypothetical protein
LKDVELELLMSLTNVQWETIRPWSDGFMLQFLQDFNRPSDPADRQRIFEKTGFWPKFVETYLGKGEIGSPKEVGALLFGNWAELVRIVDVLMQMASPASTDDVAELAELDLIACRRVLVLAERLGLALREPHDMWMADRSLMPLANKGLVSLA